MSEVTIPALIAAEVIHPDLRPLVDDPATTLRDLQIDGAARVHLAMEIEDEFGVVLSDDTVQGWDCVADVMRVVEC